MKLSQIYSNDERFKPIEFKDGLNIILGNVKNSKKINKDDSHSLGKSVLVYLIDFLLLKEIRKGNYFYNKKDIFKNHTFYLEIKLSNSKYFTIKRDFENITKVSIKFHKSKMNLIDCKQWDYKNIIIRSQTNPNNAINIINSFINFDVLSDYSFRQSLGYFIRTQEDYNDVFKLNKFRGSDINWKPYIFKLLGFNKELLIERHKLINEKEEIENKIKNLQDINISVDQIDTIKGRLDILEREKKELEEQIDNFNFYFSERELNKDLVDEIETKISIYNSHEYDLLTDIEKINESLNTDTFIDFETIQEIFNEVKVYFPDRLNKSYKDLIAFNESLTKDREKHLNILLQDKKSKLKEVQNILLDLNKQRSNLLSVLKNNDSFSKFKLHRESLIKIEREIEKLITQKSYILNANKDLKKLTKKKEDLETIKEQLYESITTGNKTLNNIRVLFNNILKEITGKDGMISVKPNKESNVEFEYGIYKDGVLTHESDGFSYKKLFCICFDLAVIANYSNKNYFRFLYHDGPIEALHKNRKKDYIDYIIKYCKNYNNIQYIITMIDSDIDPEFNDIINNNKILDLYKTEDGSGSLFGFNY